MPEPPIIPTPQTYSAAVAAGDLVFLGLHRGLGESFGQQLAGTFEGIQKRLAALDPPLESNVKANVWLRDMNDLPEMEKDFARYFARRRFPAGMTATTGFIDSDCLVMVDGMAYRPR
jgi:2-iminobutanoate/2-iminopropanoate deaminase